MVAEKVLWLTVEGKSSLLGSASEFEVSFVFIYSFDIHGITWVTLENIVVTLMSVIGLQECVAMVMEQLIDKP